jgi:WD40 repeat protein
MIVLWDIGTGSEDRLLHGDADSFNRIEFSADGRLLAAGGQGGLIKLWDASTGKVRDPLQGHTGVVRSVAFDRSGGTLAAAGEDHTIHVHDLAATAARALPVPGAVNALAFSAAGDFLAAVGDGPQSFVYLCHVGTGEATTAPIGARPAHDVALSPAAPLVATADESGTVQFWRIAAGAVERMQTIGPGPFGGAVRSVSFTPDGRYLATANANGMVYLLQVPAVH